LLNSSLQELPRVIPYPESRQFWKDEIKRCHGLFRKHLKQLVASIRQCPDLAARLDLIASIDGIALRTAAAIVVRLPEIGRLSRE
jgi:transposase